MIEIIDKRIEKYFTKILHKKRQRIINKTIQDFIDKQQPTEKVIAELRKLLEYEADRVYAIVDDSILKSGIKRAKYVFWVTAITSTLLSLIVVALTHGIALPVILPVCTAFIAWSVSLATIPISYDQRVQGSMDSTILIFEKKIAEMMGENNKSLEEKMKDLKAQLVTITEKMQQLEQEIQSAKALPTLSVDEEKQFAVLNQKFAEAFTPLLHAGAVQAQEPKNDNTFYRHPHFHFWQKIKDHPHFFHHHHSEQHLQQFKPSI